MILLIAGFRYRAVQYSGYEVTDCGNEPLVRYILAEGISDFSPPSGGFRARGAFLRYDLCVNCNLHRLIGRVQPGIGGDLSKKRSAVYGAGPIK